MLIDTHCHLNLPEAFSDPASAIEEAKRSGVDRIVVIGVDMESSRRAIELSNAHSGIFAVVGIHPNYTAGYESSHLNELEAMLIHPKVVAVGEVGLDFHWDFATPEQQMRGLIPQLELAEATGKPVVFHCRNAYPELLTQLESRSSHAWLLHCFAGDRTDAERAIQLGCYFGVDGPITYPKANDLREVVRSLPRDRVVVETDSPYLTPVPHRGKPNRPAFASLVNNGLAACLGISPEACAELTTTNAERFFALS